MKRPNAVPAWAALLTLAHAAGSAAPVTMPVPCGLPNFQQELIRQVNQARAEGRSCGQTYYAAAGQVAWNARLLQAATAHAADMAANDYFSHTSQDGRKFSQRITAAGYLWSATAENIAAGQRSVQEVMNTWLESPGHCGNIMNGNYSEIGVACVKYDASPYYTYWVMELARPR